MKSPLEKLRKIALNKSEPKENWDHRISVHVEGLAQAAKDMKEMRTCYDSLLSAAAATANSAYEFSESLLEMGNCLLEKTSIYNDGESAGPLLMLGKVQFELQRLVDCYRSHVIMTITNPSESLLSELRKVEEMKLQCDEKREMFEYMVGQVKEKGKSRHGKVDTFTPQQLQAVCDEYDDAARLCVFRVESLKQGQSRSLLTQAVRHHAAQLSFFKKGLQSLESVEPRIKNVAEMQHIDYEICDLNEDVEGNSFETRGDDELSFDYRRNQQMDDDACVSRNSVELDQLGALGSKSFKSKDSDVMSNTGKNQGEQILSQPRRVGSHSAPIFPEKSDPADRIRELRASVQKLNTHVLPTPADARTSIAVSSITSVPNPLQPTRSSKNLWHSSPLNVEKTKNEHLSGARGVGKSHMEVEDSSSNKQSLPLPLPLASGAPLQQFDTSHNTVDLQKNIRQAFSGPLASKSSSTSKPLLSGVNGPMSSTDLQSRTSGAQLPVCANNIGLSTLSSTPKISELHELPRPPDALSSKPRRSLGALGHSAPLGNRNNREVTNPLRQSREGSPLPLPQLTVSRSFSIPSSSQRALDLQSRKLLESSQVMEKVEEVASPPLTPMSLSNIKSSPNAGHIRGKVNPATVAVSSSA